MNNPNIIDKAGNLATTITKIAGLFLLLAGLFYVGYIQPRINEDLKILKLELNSRMDRIKNQLEDDNKHSKEDSEKVFNLKYANREELVILKEQVKQLQKK